MPLSWVVARISRAKSPIIFYRAVGRSVVATRWFKPFAVVYTDARDGDGGAFDARRAGRGDARSDVRGDATRRDARRDEGRVATKDAKRCDRRVGAWMRVLADER